MASFRNLLLTTAALATPLGLTSCGSSGIEFNGTNDSSRISVRQMPVKHFPLPVETYNPNDGVFEVDGVVLLLGRPAGTPDTSQAGWSEPMTAAVPVAPGSFVFKAGTEVWRATGAEDRNGNLVPDVIDWWGGQANAKFAGSASMLCQWFFQNVNGSPRTDGPFRYDGLDFNSFPITVIADQIGVLSVGSLFEGGTNKVDSRIGIRGALQPGQDIGTSNPLASRVPVSGTSENRCEFALGPGIGGSLGAYAEIPQENLFKERLSTTGMVGALVLGSLAPGGISTVQVPVPGGVYMQSLPRNLPAPYQPAISLDFYYGGMVFAHCVALGMGVPQTTYSAGSAGGGEEDIMHISVFANANFLATAGRRLQFAGEGLLHMQNVQALPVGSASRAQAELIAAQQGHFAPSSARLIETAPGPNR